MVFFNPGDVVRCIRKEFDPWTFRVVGVVSESLYEVAVFRPKDKAEKDWRHNLPGDCLRPASGAEWDKEGI
jgi:hypothetical protein